jgi:hypothetical protein
LSSGEPAIRHNGPSNSALAVFAKLDEEARAPERFDAAPSLGNCNDLPRVVALELQGNDKDPPPPQFLPVIRR